MEWMEDDIDRQLTRFIAEPNGSMNKIVQGLFLVRTKTSSMNKSSLILQTPQLTRTKENKDTTKEL